MKKIIILLIMLYSILGTSFIEPKPIAQVEKFKKDINSIWGKDLQKKMNGYSPFLKSDTTFNLSKPKVHTYYHFLFFQFKSQPHAEAAFNYLKKVGSKNFRYDCEVCWNVFDKGGVCYMIYENWIFSIGKKCKDSRKVENTREDEFYKLNRSKQLDTSFMRSMCGGGNFEFR